MSDARCEGWRAFSASTAGLFCSVVLAGIAAGWSLPPHAAERPAGCRLTDATRTKIAAVIDERTLRLADGIEARLAGLESLSSADNDAGRGRSVAVRARSELEQLTLGKAMMLQSLGEDRYGRRIALAAAPDDSDVIIQEQLIARGLGLVAGRIGHPGCASRFLAAERNARAAGLGLWAESGYLIWEASRPTALVGAYGRFALVEGNVVSVNDRGATVYVNFGRRWSEDFTVTIAKRNVRNFTAVGLDPRALAGRRVRIRGWIDERGGPWIEAFRPEQIEFADRP